MTLKKFGIFTAVIASIIIIATIVLGCIKVDNGLKLNDPDTIVVYSKSSVGVEYTSTNTPSRYNKLKKLYNDTTSLSVFDYMLKGRSLDAKPSQDIKTEEKWLESNKTNYYCIELKYNDKQTVVVSIEGDTKVIEFYSLIMEVEKSTLGREVQVYFSTSEGDYKSYSISPILVVAKQNSLLSYIKQIGE